MADDRGGRLRRDCNSKPIVHVSFFSLQRKHFSIIRSPNFLIDMMATNNTMNRNESAIFEVDARVAAISRSWLSSGRVRKFNSHAHFAIPNKFTNPNTHWYKAVWISEGPL